MSTFIGSFSLIFVVYGSCNKNVKSEDLTF